jgi:hypothetical protein
MITHINPEVLKALALDINAALKAVADKHGISLSTGRSVYADTHAEIKLHVSVVDAKGNEHTRERDALSTWSDHILAGLKYGDQVALVTGKGKTTYTVTGYKSRSGKLVLDCKDGKSWLFPAEKVVEQIKTGKAVLTKAS